MAVLYYAESQYYRAAIAAINKVFGDTDISKKDTIENLNELIGEIEVMLDVLETEIAKEE